MQPGNSSNRLGLLLIAVALAVVFGLVFPNFASLNNANSITLATSATMIAAIGSALLIITGNIDLSIGGIYAVASVVTAAVGAATGQPHLAMLAGMGAGAALGAINGVLVRRLDISPIIVTVATMIIFRGLAYMITGGNSIGGLPAGLVDFGRSSIGPVRTPIIVALALFAVFAFWITRTRSGLHFYALGANKRAAELAGIAADRMVLQAYTVNGLLVGFAAVLTTARLGIGAPTAGEGFEFDVLTAVILGGIAFKGGSGRPLGILYGLGAIGLLNAGLVFAGLPFYYQSIGKGMLLLLALAADQIVQYRNSVRQKRGAVKARQGHEATTAGHERKRRKANPELAGRSPVLQAKGLTKRYGAVVAVDDVSIDVRPGEVLCLIGDNGAGKSTLVKMLSGAIQPDQGAIRLDDQDIGESSPARLRALGLETVYQDLALCPNLSVAHNLLLGSEPTRRIAGVIPVRDDAMALTVARQRLATLGARLPSETVLVEELSGGQRQAVAIARSVRDGVKVVILDEPTAALGVHQTAAVLDLIEKTAAAGTGVILISHDIETVLGVADRVVVLRLGKISFEGPTSDLNELDLLHLMAGMPLDRPAKQ